MSDTWFITLRCLLSLYIYIFCHFSVAPMLHQSMIGMMVTEAGQGPVFSVNACVTSLAANLSSMASSHKITWSQVLWIHKSTCPPKFSHHRIRISRPDHETVALVSLSIRSWKWEQIIQIYKYSTNDCFHGPTVYNVKPEVVLYLKWSQLLFIYQFKFLKKICTFRNECTSIILAWIKYTKCLNEVLRWASSPRDTISWTIHKCSTNPILNLQKILCFLLGTLKCWW